MSNVDEAIVDSAALEQASLPEADAEARPVVRPAGAGDDEEPEGPDCPQCKSGAPAWMATFADMATLLMAFFVLLLSFSDTELPKFEQLTGSIEAAFGVRKIVPTIQFPPPEASWWRPLPRQWRGAQSLTNRRSSART